MKKILSFGLVFLALNVKPQTTKTHPFQLVPSEQKRTCGTETLPQQFESWLESVTPAGGIKGGTQNNETQSIFNIPVIVHIIHNNEAVNSIGATSGGNLNAAQVIDQINILNRDFNGTNADTNLIPTVFKPLLGKFQFNFCMAVVNPTGGVLPEPGIDRINRVSKGWNAPPYSSSYFNSTIKPNSIWDPNRYLNIWVASLSGGLLGYATFPNPGTSGLPGIPSPYGSSTSDGVVILNTAFGSIGTAANFTPYNLGRTTTHEIGHWVGLRHVWGDASCGNDYCNDTPTQQSANYGCPNFPKISCSNGPNGEMHMNYMDYTNDACMYMFSKDQKYRAQLIMTNSPMRAALLTSTVCNLPTVGNDIGMVYVVSPTYSQVINCNNYITPVVNLRNYGTTAITSASVIYNVDGSNTQTVSWSGSISPGSAVNYTLPQISNLVNGAHAFNATVTAPNGGADNNISNNTNNQLFSIINSFTLSTSSSPTICSGQTATLVGSGGATTFSWNPGAIVGATAVVSPTATTVYTLTGKTGTCVNTRTTSVVANTTPTVTLNSYTICPGGSATLTAGGANTYSWSTGSTLNPIVVTPSVSTTYSVTGYISNCTGSNSSTVTIGTGLSVITTPSVQAKCTGGTATISVSGANSYTWSVGGNGNSIVVTPTANTTYSVIGASGSCTGAATATVLITPPATINVSSADALCNGGASGTATISASGGAAPYTYSYSSGATTQTTGSLTAGNYTAQVTTSVGCISTKTFVISQPSALTLTTNVAGTSCGICNGGVTYTAGGGTPGYTYSVTPGGSNLNLCSGNYTVISNDGNGCAVTSAISVGSSSAISAGALTSSATCGTCADGSATVTPSGGTGPYTYTWLPSGGNASVATELMAGCYTVEIADAGTCTHSKVVCIDLDVNAGLRHNSISGAFKIYPNPAGENVILEFENPGNRNIELIDITGRVMLNKKSSAQLLQIDLIPYSDGIYYLMIQDEKGRQQFKLVKQ